MANLKIIIDGPLMDGHRVTFKAPCACTGIDKLDIRYVDGDTQKSKLFTMKDTHGNNLTGLGNLFDEGAYVQAILSLSDNGAYLLNAATNGYLETKLADVEVLKTHNHDGKYVAAGKVANNLTTTAEGYVLDARQGKNLNDKIENLRSGKWTVTTVVSEVSSKTYTTSTTEHDFLVVRGVVDNTTLTEWLPLGIVGTLGGWPIKLAHGSNAIDLTISTSSIVVSNAGGSSLKIYYLDRK